MLSVWVANVWWWYIVAPVVTDSAANRTLPFDMNALKAPEEMMPSTPYREVRVNTMYAKGPKVFNILSGRAAIEVLHVTYKCMMAAARPRALKSVLKTTELFSAAFKLSTFGVR
uniref:Uncharacterized protein n=1 Tax=Sipha flava TaxID=143950 RepID=A0A2S2QQJ3_9HEMI